jgi:hypothetical protein
VDESLRPKPLLTSVMARCVLVCPSVDVRGCTSLPGPPVGGQANVPGRDASRSSCSFLGRAAPSPPQSLLSGYDDVPDVLWRVGSLGGPCGSGRRRQQEQGQGVAQPVLVVVGAPSSMAGEFSICVGIGEGSVGGRGVCGAHSFAEGPLWSSMAM